jgi:hypothetical protein
MSRSDMPAVITVVRSSTVLSNDRVDLVTGVSWSQFTGIPRRLDNGRGMSDPAANGVAAALAIAASEGSAGRASATLIQNTDLDTLLDSVASLLMKTTPRESRRPVERAAGWGAN